MAPVSGSLRGRLSSQGAGAKQAEGVPWVWWGHWQKVKEHELCWVPSEQKGMCSQNEQWLFSCGLVLCLELDCELDTVQHRDEEHRFWGEDWAGWESQLWERLKSCKAATLTPGGGISGYPWPRTNDRNTFASCLLPLNKSVWHHLK